jgi:hypothetical protein
MNSSRRKRLLEEAAKKRAEEPPIETTDLTRVFERFFTQDRGSDRPPETEHIVAMEQPSGGERLEKALPLQTQAPIESGHNKAELQTSQTSLNPSTTSKARSRRNPVTTDSSSRGTRPPESLAPIEPSSGRARLPESLVLTELHHVTLNILDDQIMPTLSTLEQVVLRRLYRLSFGFQRMTTDPVSLSTLARKCNIGLSTLKKILPSLEQRGLIERVGESKYHPRGGNRYRVLPNLNLATRELGSIGARLSGGHIKDDDDDDHLNDHHHHHHLNLATREPGSIGARFHHGHTKDDDDDQLKQNHHQNETMNIYQQVTGNVWTKADTETYSDIKHLPIESIEQGIRLAASRAKTPPNSLAYFKTEILRQANPSPQTRAQQKQALGEIIQRIRNAHAGAGNYTIADLAEDVKRACIKDSVAFDNDLFSEIVGLG